MNAYTLTGMVCGIFITMQPVFAAVYWPDCKAIGDREIPVDVRRVDCDQREIAKKILVQEDVAPTVLYHYGQSNYMEENVAARTIPEAAWNAHIMGNEGRFNLNPIRRGLYGSTTLDTNTYRDLTYSGLIEIHVRPECTKANKVVSLAHLASDSKFTRWFQTARGLPFSSVDEVKSRCFPEGAGSTIDFVTGLQYSVGKNSINKCSSVIERFLQDADIKVIQDDVTRKAFYVRDRSCIETIRGTPEELVQIFADKAYLWMNSCVSSPLSSTYDMGDLFSIVVSALKEARTEIPQATYDELIGNINLIHPVSFDFRNEWTAVLRAHQRCVKLKKLSEFVDAMPDYFETTNSYTSNSIQKLDQLCQQGPPADQDQR